MKTLTINVPDMQSPHCETIVANAIRTVYGASVQHIEARTVSVSLSSENQKDIVLATIEKAGYTVQVESGETQL